MVSRFPRRAALRTPYHCTHWEPSRQHRLVPIRVCYLSIPWCGDDSSLQVFAIVFAIGHRAITVGIVILIEPIPFWQIGRFIGIDFELLFFDFVFILSILTLIILE